VDSRPVERVEVVPERMERIEPLRV
jgi:hypothetical protein